MLNRANIGCGRTPTDGWLNFDNSITVRFSGYLPLLSILGNLGLINRKSVVFAADARAKGLKWADALKRIPVPDGSLEIVYCSHMFEHLTPPEGERFLREVRRTLKPGGFVRLVVPDLRRRVEKYMLNGDADEFFVSLNVRDPSRGSLWEKLLAALSGDRAHKWMYDTESLVRLLGRMDFADAQGMPPGLTSIPN